MIDWQPIETVPVGEVLLLCAADVQWIRHGYLPHRRPSGEKCWHDDWSDGNGVVHYPTHWARPNFP